MNILITGAAGFIVFHLTKHLLSNDLAGAGLDNFNDYYSTSLKYDRLSQLGIEESVISEHQAIFSSVFPKFAFQKIDITNQEKLDEFFTTSKPDIVYHLASQAGVRYSLENSSAYAETNFMGFFNVLDAARESGVKHFIYASSSSVYG
jgi:UDP-glucuronate 4-epimerase